jgi:hypothetical protein
MDNAGKRAEQISEDGTTNMVNTSRIMGTICRSLKLTIQSTEKCYGRSSQLLGTRKLNRSAQKLYTDVTINLRVGEKLEQFLSTSGVKQGDNPSTVLFIFVIHAVSNTTRNGISQPLTLDGFRTLKLEASPRGQLRGTNHSTRAQCSRSSSPIMSTIRPSFFSAAEVIAASSLSSHFRRFGLTIHTGSKRKGEDSKRRPFTFRGLDRNHRLLIWRTSKSTPTALCPLHQVQILRILLRAGTQ